MSAYGSPYAYWPMSMAGIGAMAWGWPRARLSLSADIHLSVLNISCDLMYSAFSGDGLLMTDAPRAKFTAWGSTSTTGGGPAGAPLPGAAASLPLPLPLAWIAASAAGST